MKLKSQTFTVQVNRTLKTQILNWANEFNACACLDNNNYQFRYSSFDLLVAAGAFSTFAPHENYLHELKKYLQTQNTWLFGHFGYDLKNEIEGFHSEKTDHIYFPDVFLFQPLHVISIQQNRINIQSVTDDPEKIWKEILSFQLKNKKSHHANFSIQPRINKEEYLKKIEILKSHIHRGDCYEINFCQEFFASDAHISPLHVYNKLIKLASSPFSCYYKLHDKYVLCASPERFLKKNNHTIISQPMKGTAARDLFNETRDRQLKYHLKESKKEQSENIMIVDLVRNDLSKICLEGSVHAEEIFGVYTFPQVHQMISTISGNLKENIDLSDILKATFPMGSMTGAPKRRVLQLIEEYEVTKRGIFSGAIGYITPEHDFDFNVVIRSIVYNSSSKYVSYHAGSGITFYADPENEYEECLLKAAAMQEALR